MLWIATLCIACKWGPEKSWIQGLITRPAFSEFRVINFPMENPQLVHQPQRAHDEEQRSGDKTFKCKVENCDKIFGFKQALEIHQRSAGHGKNKLTCQHVNCTASFSAPSSMLRHIRTVHLKEKPFSCLEQGCGKKFRDNAELKRHTMLVHLSEKPFSCLEPGCGRKFSYKTVLQCHLRRAHGAPKLACKCDNCTAVFNHPCNLSRHVRSVHLNLKNKSFTCLDLENHLRSAGHGKDEVKQEAEVTNEPGEALWWSLAIDGKWSCWGEVEGCV